MEGKEQPCADYHELQRVRQTEGIEQPPSPDPSIDLITTQPARRPDHLAISLMELPGSDRHVEGAEMETSVFIENGNKDAEEEESDEEEEEEEIQEVALPLQFALPPGIKPKLGCIPMPKYKFPYGYEDSTVST